MKKFLMATIAAGVALAGATSAEARDGCGPGGYRGPYGHCRPIRGGAYGHGPAVLVIGQYYQGRGYWDGRRYNQRRNGYQNRGGYQGQDRGGDRDHGGDRDRGGDRDH